jgi:hemerythrin
MHNKRSKKPVYRRLFNRNPQGGGQKAYKRRRLPGVVCLFYFSYQHGLTGGYGMATTDFVEWEDRFSVGVALIDEQHKKLVDITNDLFRACQSGDEKAREFFRATTHTAVDYVKFHFSTEEQVMERIHYPGMAEHKSQHADFVKEVLANVKNFEEGRKFVPNQFVRFLRDWVLTHIAVTDTKLGAYLIQMKKSGQLKNLTMKVKNTG